MPELRLNLNLAPADAVRMAAQKGMKVSWNWFDLEKEENVHSFTVAKATSLDVLSAIRAEVMKSIGGQTYESFKKSLRPRLQEMGWWGRHELLDADTGEITKVTLGSCSRLRTIYQANVQTSYMAGRYKRYSENADQRPYWRYVAIMDGRTRPAHRALHGKVFRFDDPIWKVIWPPNGWGCRCRVTALTYEEFKSLGVPLSSGADSIVEREVTINRDGETRSVKGLRFIDDDGKEKTFFPDVGWDYNPGETWARFDKNGAIPDCDWGHGISFAEGEGKTCLAGIPGQKTWQDYGRPALSAVPQSQRLPTPDFLQWQPTRPQAVETLAQALDVSENRPIRIVSTPVGEVALHYQWLAHIVEKDNDKRERYGNFILPTLESPFEIWLSEYEDGFRHRYVGLFEDLGLLTIVRVNKDGSLLWNMMRAKDAYINRQRAGILLFGK
jgi:SPP1 gp7 family putative phage head morphogenesis protein